MRPSGIEIFQISVLNSLGRRAKGWKIVVSGPKTAVASLRDADIDILGYSENELPE